MNAEEFIKAYIMTEILTSKKLCFKPNNFKFNRNIMLGIIFTITLFIISISLSLIFTINSSVNKTVDNQIIVHSIILIMSINPQ